jgi:hypothetical protein
VGKSKYTSVNFDLEYQSYSCDFVPHIFAAVQENIDKKQIDLGLQLLQTDVNSFDIPV